MTNIKFFFNVENKMDLVFSLLPERLNKKRNSLIYCSNNIQLNNLSDKLWGASSGSFFPHEENNHHNLNKITLSNKSIEWMDDTIINISSQMIDGFNRYLNLFEIVSIDEEDKKLARIRFQYFKDRGYNIQSIDTKKT
ncbi:DNA polymerase III subunit chi [Methylophilaceae bacterium]|nr:DNA polymerase III subunit chi [Methylophilaceae bacterium]